MKPLIKLLILASVSLPVGASATIYAVNNYNQSHISATEITIEDDTCQMKNDNYTFVIDKKTLHFTITKGSQTWDSAPTVEGDGLTALRRALLVSPVTLYSYNKNGGETNISLLDNNLKPTIKMSKAGNTLYADITVIQGLRSNPTLAIDFTINYALLDDGLEISVSDIEEWEESNNSLSKMTIYPGFGMTYQLNDGYILIPDGSGAIIDLSKPTSGQSAIQMTTYGKDIGVASNNKTYYSPEQLSLPMYAVSENNKSMMVTVEEGQEFSELNVKSAGISDQYNTSFFRFIFKELTYQYYGISESSRKSVPQENRNEFNPVIHYHLYDKQMNYSDFAKEYRNYLLDNSYLNDERSLGGNLRLEFLMGDNKKALFGKEYVKMTSTYFIKDKVNKLLDQIDHLSISLRGYSSNGFDSSYPYTFPVYFDHDYSDLGSYLNSKGVPFNFNVDTVRSFSSSHSKLAMNMSQKLISSNDYVNGTNITFYRVNPSETASLIRDYEYNLDKYSATGFDFSSIGYDLFSTYHKEYNSRTSSIKVYRDALKAYSHQSNMRKPNLYLYPYFSNYLDTPTSGSGFMMETESVPFLSMVLSGYKTFYSSPINLNYLGNKQLLDLINNNIYPSYLLTEEDTMKLIDSPASSYIYSSQYDNWENDFLNSYNKVTKTLLEVKGACFISREMVLPSVYKNIYDNNKAIIINYTNETVNVDGKDIAPLSSEVVSL